MHKQAQMWINEFWNAKESYDYWSNVDSPSAKIASKRMHHAVRELVKMGAISEGQRMPPWR